MITEPVYRISGSDSNTENFPPSAACFNFSREEIFCHLVQSLLLAKSPIFNRFASVNPWLPSVRIAQQNSTHLCNAQY